MTVDPEAKQEKKDGDGCTRMMLTGFAFLACMAFGRPLTFATGKTQLDELSAAAVVRGGDLAELEDGTAVRLSGTLMDDHPMVRPDNGYIAVRHRTRRIRGDGPSNYVERDQSESELPTLRFQADGVQVTLDADYFIVHTDTVTLDDRSSDFLEILQYGLLNGEQVGVFGVVSASDGPDEPLLRDGRIISGNAQSLPQYYENKLYPFYQIGQVLLGIGALMGIWFLVQLVMVIIAVVRFATTPPKMDEPDAS